MTEENKEDFVQETGQQEKDKQIIWHKTHKKQNSSIRWNTLSFKC